VHRGKRKDHIVILLLPYDPIVAYYLFLVQRENHSIFGKAFTNKDDVCLVLKVVDKPIAQPFEVSFRKIFNDFKNKFKNHGEVEVITDFIEDIDILYRACDALFSPTHSECFALTPLEALAAGKLVIMSNWGGQLDFLNKDNSLLIDGKEIFAPPTALYWQAKSGTKYFLPDINDSVDKLRFAFNNRERLVEKFKGKINFQEYSWDNVSKKIINLCV
jgi:glycosyltransferase involved in cell wall biosynthesis